ncbi:bifunctional endoribonuclease/protein kinase ire1 [Cladochytrium tenue]|nr:bifunctional endoribonuclease/protein kinase ire1 [Cladochytrium tenue]
MVLIALTVDDPLVASGGQSTTSTPGTLPAQFWTDPFRLSSGGVLTQTFKPDDTLEALVGFVAEKTGTPAAQIRVATAFPPRRPLEDRAATVKELGLVPRPVSFSARDVLLVATVDGACHAVHKPSGRTLWSLDHTWGPLVHVEENPQVAAATAATAGPPGRLPPPPPAGIGPGGAKIDPQTDDGGVFIPEPAGDGNLYHLVPGMPIQKLPFSIKQAVSSPSFSDGRVAYTSKKVSRLLAVDAVTGTILKEFGVDEHEESYGPGLLLDPILISRTEYILTITDVATGHIRWNISYGEYASASIPLDGVATEGTRPSGLDSPVSSDIRVSSSVTGLVTLDTGSKGWFSTPAISAFDVGSFENGVYHISKVFPPAEGDTSRVHQFGEADSVFVGAIQNSLYLLSPDYSHVMPGPHAHSDEEPDDAAPLRVSGPPTNEDAGPDPDAKAVAVVFDTVCLPGHPRYPSCVTGLYKLSADSRKGMDSQSPRGGGLAAIIMARLHHKDALAQWAVKFIEIFVISVIALAASCFWVEWPVKIRAETLTLRLRAFLGDTTAATALLRPATILPSHTTVDSPIGDFVDMVPLVGVSLGAAPSDRDVGSGSAAAADGADASPGLAATAAAAAVQLAKHHKKRRTRPRKKPQLGTLEIPAATSDSDASAAEDDEPDGGGGGDAVVDTSQGPPAKPTSPQTIAVSDEILGHGSHGTVVFRGTFANREVAVKRLLLDFYDVAHHEIEVLRDSDHHPNVIRYYFQEATDKFMYIALELCPTSLFDVIENPTSDMHRMIRQALQPRSVIFQMLSGLRFLHALKIVHRDIKPQNILIGEYNPKTQQHPRIVISDFGLSKRLTDEQSSFNHTVTTLGGTVGWRAPEIMLAAQRVQRHQSLLASSGPGVIAAPDRPPEADDNVDDPNATSDASDIAAQWIMLPQNAALRITRAVDVFSAGCVAFYALTFGSHPFGDRFSREINILKGNHRLDRLDRLDAPPPAPVDSTGAGAAAATTAAAAGGCVGAHEARDLVRRMIQRDPARRPSAAAALHHPFFWSAAERLAFLQDVSDQAEAEPRGGDTPSPLLRQLERGAAKVVGRDWTARLDRALVEDLGKFRKYDGALLRDLLRSLRNKRHHYQDLPAETKQLLGDIPDGFLAYFSSRFPALLLHVYAVIADSRTLRAEPQFRVYFEEGRRDASVLRGG